MIFARFLGKLLSKKAKNVGEYLWTGKLDDFLPDLAAFLAGFLATFLGTFLLLLLRIYQASPAMAATPNIAMVDLERIESFRNMTSFPILEVKEWKESSEFTMKEVRVLESLEKHNMQTRLILYFTFDFGFVIEDLMW